MLARTQANDPWMNRIKSKTTQINISWLTQIDDPLMQKRAARESATKQVFPVFASVYTYLHIYTFRDTVRTYMVDKSAARESATNKVLAGNSVTMKQNNYFIMTCLSWIVRLIAFIWDDDFTNLNCTSGAESCAQGAGSVGGDCSA